MSHVTVKKWVDNPVDQEYLDSFPNYVNRWHREIKTVREETFKTLLKRYGGVKGYYSCFEVKGYNKTVVQNLLLHSGYLFFIAAKYFGFGKYFLYFHGKPLTKFTGKHGKRKALPHSYFMGTKWVGVTEVEKFENNLTVLRGNSSRLELEHPLIDWHLPGFPRFTLELNSRLTNGENLVDRLQNDVLLSSRLPEYNFLNDVQLSRIDDMMKEKNKRKRSFGKKSNGKFVLIDS